jgi:hypothetical protein
MSQSINGFMEFMLYLKVFSIVIYVGMLLVLIHIDRKGSK